MVVLRGVIVPKDGVVVAVGADYVLFEGCTFECEPNLVGNTSVDLINNVFMGTEKEAKRT